MNWSSLTAFVLNISHDKEKYVVIVKDKGVNDQVELKSESTSTTFSEKVRLFY